MVLKGPPPGAPPQASAADDAFDTVAVRYLNDMLALIEQLEVGLQLESDAGNANNVRTATADVIPDEYQESVAEYYRRLSRE